MLSDVQVALDARDRVAGHWCQNERSDPDYNFFCAAGHLSMAITENRTPHLLLCGITSYGSDEENTQMQRIYNASTNLLTDYTPPAFGEVLMVFNDGAANENVVIGFFDDLAKYLKEQEDAQSI